VTSVRAGRGLPAQGRALPRGGDVPTLRVSPSAVALVRCHTVSVRGSAAVLVVDDHDSFRSLARKLLEAAGFAVTEAANGAEATRQAECLHPNLVLLDIQLPDFDGFEVARRLAAKELSAVIVLMSSRDAGDFGGRIAASPAVGFLPKDELSGAALRRFLVRG
jgi:CheY-like chemotaxis protein